MSIGFVVLVLWFVMSRQTKSHIGSAVATTAQVGSEFMLIQREKQRVQGTVEVKELMTSSSTTLEEVDAFSARLGLGGK